MKRTRLLFGLCCLLAICSLPLKAQDNRNMYLRWGIMAGLNGYNAHTLNLSDDRGRYGFNLAARAELSFTDAPSRMYLDAELGLLKLGWKDGQAGYAIDALRFPGHGTTFPFLKEDDIRLCCLVKMEMPLDLTALIFGIGKGSVSQRKQRLRQKMELEGSLDEYLGVASVGRSGMRPASAVRE